MNKIKIFLFLSFSSILLFSCKSVATVHNKKADNIVATAKSYLGTKYKYGGTSKFGMDCSGLIYTSFSKNNIQLPRTSFQQSKQGQNIHIHNITKGDLVFFKNPNSRQIDHVGLVVSNDQNNIKFIHSTNSLGVIISSTKEAYWKKTFVKGKRILNLTTTNNKVTTYTVKTGDTLYGISKKHHTSVENIKKLNNLKSNNITIGMTLMIK